MEKELFVPLMLWVAFLVSNFIYALLPQLMANQGILMDPLFLAPDFQNPIEQGLTLAALFAAAASFVVPNIIGKANGARLGSSATEAQKFQLGFSSFIIQLALREAPAVMGVVMMVQAKQAGKAFPFLIASFALLLLSRPTKEKFHSFLGQNS